jgi:protein-S-isoprenylcysteine O-methyltransferase Ste14
MSPPGARFRRPQTQAQPAPQRRLGLLALFRLLDTRHVAASPHDQPGANTAFWVLFGLFALGEYAMRVRSRLNRSGTRAERWSLVVVVIAVTGGLLGGLWSAGWQATTITAGRWPVFIAGLLLMAGGIYVRQWAIFTLGRFFTADVRVHSQQTVIDRGPYRWVRHPSYSGLVIFFLGLGLALTNWMSLLVLVVVPTAGLVVRIHSEERALLAGLGEPYRRYAAAHQRLFPGVW